MMRKGSQAENAIRRVSELKQRAYALCDAGRRDRAAGKARVAHPCARAKQAYGSE